MSQEKNIESEDPIWTMRMKTLMKRKRNMETAQIIDKALFDYYNEKGMEVPQWKTKKDPEWWIDYLREIYEEE